jgi:hypothetical protein
MSRMPAKLDAYLGEVSTFCAPKSDMNHTDCRARCGRTPPGGRRNGAVSPPLEGLSTIHVDPAAGPFSTPTGQEPPGGSYLTTSMPPQRESATGTVSAAQASNVPETLAIAMN